MLLVDEVVIIFHDCLLEVDVRHVLDAAKVVAILSIKIESVEEERILIVFVFIPFEFDFTDFFFISCLVDRKLDLSLLFIFIKASLQGSQVSELCEYRKVVAAEAHGLQCFQMVHLKRGGIRVLGILFNRVAREYFVHFRFTVAALIKRPSNLPDLLLEL